MSETIRTILEDVRTAAESDSYAEMERLLDELDDAYTEQERIDRARVERARLAREEYDRGSTESERLSDHIERGIAIELSRAGVLGTVSAYVADPVQAETERLVETLSSTAEEEATFTAGAAEVRPVVDAVSLPAQLSFTGVDVPDQPYLKGESVPITAVLENIGDESTAVSASVDTDGLETVSSLPEVSSLGAGERAELAVEVVGSSTGSYTLQFEASSDTAGNPLRKVDVEIQDKATLIETLRTELDALQTRVGESVSDDGPATALNAKLSNADANFEQAEQFVEQGRAKQANNVLSAGVNILGAVLNQLDDGPPQAGGSTANGKGGNDEQASTGRLSASVAAALRARVRNLLETAVDARNAAI